MMCHLQIDAVLTRIKAAVATAGKLKLARAANIAESNLRHLSAPDWNPTFVTLRKLEIAAEAVLAERAAKDASQSVSHSALPSGAEAAGVPLSLPASAASLCAHEGVSPEVTAAGAADPASAGSLRDAA